MARGLALAWRMSRGAERPLPFHVVYLFEAVRVVRWMEAAGARHVHAHFGTNSTEVVMLARALGGPGYSFTAHGPEEFDKPEALGLAAQDLQRRRSWSPSARSVAASCADGCRARSGPRSKSCTAVSRRSLRRRAAEDIASRAAGAAPGVRRTRLCEQKGQLLLVAAAAMLARQGVAFELVLAGDGEMRAEIEAAIASHGIADRVRITGWISSAQVRDELLAARALVLPSFAEGLPVVIMEAMALGRPVISTFIAGIPELVRDGTRKAG